MADSPLLEQKYTSDKGLETGAIVTENTPSEIKQTENSNSIEFINQYPDYLSQENNIENNKKQTADEKTNPLKENKRKMVEKVDIIGRVTGDFGVWQMRTVLLIFLCKIPSSWFMACIIFTAPDPQHGEFYCKPPTGIAISNKTEYIKITHPVFAREDKEFDIDFCNVYEDAQEHAQQYFHTDRAYNVWDRPKKNASILPCDSFEHHSDYESIITQFDLVCSRDILVAVTQFFHLFGVLLGGILATKLLEHFSPRRVMLAGMISQIIVGNITGLVNSYELHVFFRCMSAVCCALMYTAGQMIFVDITAGKAQKIICTLFEQFWSIGVILLPGLASFFSSWSHLYMAISFPTLALIVLHRWIPDSPRWFLKRGLVAETKEILIDSARINNCLDSLPNDLEKLLQIQAAATLEEPPPAGWWVMWETLRVKINLIAVHLAWSIYIIIYYGMLLNIRMFGRNFLQVNTVLAGLSEITGVFIGLYLILHTKYKWQWTSLFNLCGGCMAYLIWFIPPTITGNLKVVLQMITAMSCKIAISTTLSILTTCTTEIVSPEKKKICAFSTIVWARIWLLTAPFIGATSIFGKYIPQTAFASLGILGALCTCIISTPRTLPKTKTKQTNYPMELTTPEIWTTKKEKITV